MSYAHTQWLEEMHYPKTYLFGGKQKTIFSMYHANKTQSNYFSPSSKLKKLQKLWLKMKCILM